MEVISESGKDPEMAQVQGRGQSQDEEPRPTPAPHGPHLDALLTAAEEPGVGQLQGLFGLGALLTVVLQPAELALVDGEGLQRLLWTKGALQESERRARQRQASDGRTLAGTGGTACRGAGHL